MADKRGIVWLASYPKSGNTWTRIFLANYLVNGDKPVPINQAHRFAMGDSVAKTYAMAAQTSINTGDLDQVLDLRGRVLRGIVANGADVNFVKTHNFQGSMKGRLLIPKELTRSAVYIVRNPLDVVVSYARHFGLTHKQAAAALSNVSNWIAPTGDTVGQFLGRWDQHVKSWTVPADYPQLILRYEDLLTDPVQHFANLLTHIGIPIDQLRLKKAIEFSSFKELSQQEEKGGFEEKSQFTKAFFGRGQAAQWKSALSPELVMQIRADHGKTMEKFGYLDE